MLPSPEPEGAAPKTVLVVDDDRSLRVVTSINLQAAGFVVVEADSGAAALELARSTPPSIVLLDVMMPGMNGWEVAEQLRRMPETQDVPVVFVSAKTEVADQVHGYELGAVDYITKPYRPLELASRVDETLARVAESGAATVRRERLAALLRAS
jgi:DNA-binding response OmpR family regulator